jgi:hypothetical protein
MARKYRIRSIKTPLINLLHFLMLHLQDVDGERCALVGGEEGEAVIAAASLLGLSVQKTAQVLLQRQINVRGNITEIPLRQQEVIYRG